jgi:hypothetical protein
MSVWRLVPLVKGLPLEVDFVVPICDVCSICLANRASAWTITLQGVNLVNVESVPPSYPTIGFRVSSFASAAALPRGRWIWTVSAMIPRRDSSIHSSLRPAAKGF